MRRTARSVLGLYDDIFAACPGTMLSSLGGVDNLLSETLRVSASEEIKGQCVKQVGCKLCSRRG